MISTLLLVERDDQVKDFIARGLHQDAQWIALDVSAAAYLDQLNLPYAHPAEFYDAKDLEAICLQGHRQIAALCQSLDTKLQQDDPALAAAGVRPFEFHIVPLTMMTDALRGRIFQLKQLFKAFPTQRICIHRPPFAQWGY